MRKLLERSVASAAERLVVVAPPHVRVARTFGNVAVDIDRHADLLREMQRFRGRIYLNDGAIRAEHLTEDGLHQTAEDERAWHLLLMNERQQVTGCIWYLEHETIPALEDLRVYHCPVARQGESQDRLRAAVTVETEKARRERVRYAEVGGWAISKKSKPADCLLAILGTYGLSQLLGGALVIAMATIRNCSAPILRRLGGSSLESDGEQIPGYYDPRYGCEMEILRFDTRRPEGKFARLVDVLRGRLLDAMVVASQSQGDESILPPTWLQDVPTVPVWQPAIG